MCGISGIINKNNNVVDLESITHMTNLIKHRGPDDEGFFIKNNFAFGFRRLAILDLSADGHQPMHYLDQRYTLIFNGEIYNYLELKKELIENNYKFKSNTDSEVILASYDMWGEDCVNKFNGMWSFAIYDSINNKIFCSRDRFGIKPFYYSSLNSQFIFGSEIKQLLHFQKNTFVNKEVLIDFIATSFCEHKKETFFEEISTLPPSSNLVYDLSSNSYTIYKYYNIPFDSSHQEKSFEQAFSDFSDEFNRSIEYRLRSDVKVGTCLSGGLDSSTVATIASNKYNLINNDRFTAIHAKSSEVDSDESYYAKTVAKNSNIDLHIIEPSIEDFKNSINEVAYTQEEPYGSPSIIMQYFVLKKANDIGCKVMLDGQAGDETLLGYEKYFPAAYYDIFKKYGLVETIKQIIRSNENNSRMNIFWITKFIVGNFSSKLRKIVHKRNARFLRKHNNLEFLDTLSKNYLNINKLQEQEIASTNLPALLRYEDKNSMRHSVEARLPFLDYKFLETALNTNIQYKISNGWTKFILRKFLNQFMPDEVVWRKNKLGFNAPENTWIKEIDSDIKKTITNSKILRKVCNMNTLLAMYNKIDIRLKWRLYSIAIWEGVYKVQIR